MDASKTILFSGPLAAKHLHLQHQVVQSDRRVVQACRPLDRQQKESSLQSGVKKRKLFTRDGRPAPRGKGGAPPRPAPKKMIAAPPRPAPQNTIAAQPRPAPPVEVVKTAGRLRGKMKTLKL